MKRIILGLVVLTGILFSGTYEDAVQAYKAGDIEKAKVLFIKASEEGNPDGQLVLGTVYLSEKKFDEAYKYLEMSAKQGNTQAQFLLGSNYANGVGVKKNYAKAIKYLEQAEDKGGSKVSLMLGLLYVMGGNGIQQDDNKAYYYWNKSAKQGNAQAQENLDFFCKSHSSICKK